MAAHIGDVFEGEVQKVMKLLKESHLVGLHRLSDSKSAGNLVAGQPSDYLLGLPEGCSNLLSGQRLMFLEAKASEVHASLGKSMVRPVQRGAIGTFRYLLDLPYLILFWSANNGTLQMWDGIAVHGESRINKAHMLAQWENCGTISRLRTEAVAQHLVNYFQIPPKAVTLSKAR